MAEVDGQDPVPLLRGGEGSFGPAPASAPHLDSGPSGHDSRVGREQVDRPGPPLGPAYQGLHLGIDRDVHPPGQGEEGGGGGGGGRPAALLADPLGPFEVKICDYNGGGTSSGEGEAEGRADATGPTGHDDHLAPRQEGGGWTCVGGEGFGGGALRGRGALRPAGWIVDCFQHRLASSLPAPGALSLSLFFYLGI